MKRWLLIPLLSLAISTQSLAYTSTGYQTEQILLSYQEFSQLTHAEQKTYVRKLREVMIDVAKAYPEMAEQMSARSNFYAQLWTLALKDAMAIEGISDETRESFVKYAVSQSKHYMEEVEKAKTEKITPQGRAQLAAQYREALYWSAASAQYGYDITDEALRTTVLSKDVNPGKTRVEKAEAKVKAVVDESEYRTARDDYFKKAHSGQLGVNSTYPKNTLIDFGERLPASAAAAPASKPAEVKPAEVKPEVKKEEKKEEKKPEPVVKPKEEKPAEKKEDRSRKKEEKPAPAGEPKAETAKPAEAAGGVLYRCMYAGFVIKSHPCVAPSKLPWDLKGLDSEKFACGNGTVMCNPFLFGFKTSCDWSKATDEKGTQACYDKAKPICVKPGLYATKNCGEASNNDSAIEAAVHLIHSNAAAFNLFSDSFGDLCQKGLINLNAYEGQTKPKNTARTKADIQRTCDSARTRMKEIRQRYNIVKGTSKTSAPAAAPAPETKGAK